MNTVVVLFTRDLRMHDHPALMAALDGADAIVPLFVLDEAVLAGFGAPNRVAFLLDSLADLRSSLALRGSDLVLRRGDAVEEAVRVAVESGARSIHVSEDVSAFAQAREERLRRAAGERRIDVRAFPGITIVPPGDLVPGGGAAAFRVFTPYWNRWRAAPRRAVLSAPESLPALGPLERGRLPELAELTRTGRTAHVALGGEARGRERLAAWLRAGLADYDARREDLAVGVTSGLSPYLHFGCVSPLEVAERSRAVLGSEQFLRQLCWRDFHHQLLAAEPAMSWSDHRSRDDRWRDDTDGLAAWKEGVTGYPLVDAGMRQLLAEGWMHNRARLVTASFLTKHLYVDWRLGAAHFAAHLVDGDVANNTGNWQWVAGTGADTRHNRVFNPTRQARRFDPEGAYVRRWVPELEGVEGELAHEPWRVAQAAPRGYPRPIVAHEEAVRRFLEARSRKPPHV